MSKKTMLKVLADNKERISDYNKTIEERISILKCIYIDYLSDDPIEGSVTDRKILDALDSVKTILI